MHLTCVYLRLYLPWLSTCWYVSWFFELPVFVDYVSWWRCSPAAPGPWSIVGSSIRRHWVRRLILFRTQACWRNQDSRINTAATSSNSNFRGLQLQVSFCLASNVLKRSSIKCVGRLYRFCSWDENLIVSSDISLSESSIFSGRPTINFCGFHSSIRRSRWAQSGLPFSARTIATGLAVRVTHWPIAMPIFLVP